MHVAESLYIQGTDPLHRASLTQPKDVRNGLVLGLPAYAAQHLVRPRPLAAFL